MNTFNEQDYLGRMLNWLEAEDFHLWFDEKTCEWSIFPGDEFDGELPDDVFLLKGGDKNCLIEKAFHSLFH